MGLWEKCADAGQKMRKRKAKMRKHRAMALESAAMKQGCRAKMQGYRAKMRGCRAEPNHPTEPSRLTAKSFCASTANSMGSLLITSLA